MSLGTMLWGEILFFPLQERVRQAGLLRRSAVASAAIFPNRNKTGMKEFAVRWRISKFFHAVGWIIVLFLLNVFQTVKCYCRDNDDTFKYELEVCVDTEDCKGVDQYGENKYADYYA